MHENSDNSYYPIKIKCEHCGQWSCFDYRPCKVDSCYAPCLPNRPYCEYHSQCHELTGDPTTDPAIPLDNLEIKGTVLEPIEEKRAILYIEERLRKGMGLSMVKNMLCWHSLAKAGIAPEAILSRVLRVYRLRNQERSPIKTDKHFQFMIGHAVLDLVPGSCLFVSGLGIEEIRQFGIEFTHQFTRFIVQY